MRYRQMIEIGTHFGDIFALDCVREAYKDGSGKAFYRVEAVNANFADQGQWLAEDWEGLWHVLTAEQAMKEGGEQ